MRRTVNSTRRKRIERRHVQIELRRLENSRPRIEARFSWEELELPDTARIVVEPYRHGFSERLDFGTVADPTPPSKPLLRELDGERLQFRVKVVEPGTGRLLALARRLPASDGEEGIPRRELFRVKEANLAQELWRVEVEECEMPTLLLNSQVPDVVLRFREPAFRASILPSAMRQVLLHLWWDGVAEDEDPDMDDWKQRWLIFGAQLAEEEIPQGDSDAAVRAWIDKACTNFANRHKLVDSWLATVQPGEGL